MRALQHSIHSAIRTAQRGLNDDEIDYVYQFGSRYHAGGALVYFLRHRDVPLTDQRNDFLTRLEGTALVVSPDNGTLLTTWRNRRNGLKQIRKKIS